MVLNETENIVNIRSLTKIQCYWCHFLQYYSCQLFVLINPRRQNKYPRSHYFLLINETDETTGKLLNINFIALYLTNMFTKQLI